CLCVLLVRAEGRLGCVWHALSASDPRHCVTSARRDAAVAAGGAGMHSYERSTYEMFRSGAAKQDCSARGLCCVRLHGIRRSASTFSCKNRPPPHTRSTWEGSC